MVGSCRVRRSECGKRPSARRWLSDRDAASGGRAVPPGGEFLEIDPPERLSYTFRWEEPDPEDRETVVVLSLRDIGRERAELVLAQGDFATERRRVLHEEGWSQSLDKLEELLSAAAAD